MADATKTYKAVKVEKGRGGWGGPLTIKPSPQKPYVVSITGDRKKADQIAGYFKRRQPASKVIIRDTKTNNSEEC